MALELVHPIGGARDLALGLAGQYFVANNPTPGTGLIGHAAPTTFDETKPYLFVRNEGTDRWIIPMYLRLTTTVVSVGNSIMRFTQAIDTKTTTRYTSGGTALAPTNTNMRSSDQAGGATIYAGAVVAAAVTTARRVLGTQTCRTVIGVVGDIYQWSWGAHEMMDPASLITTGTAVSNAVFGLPPVALAPNDMLLIHQWAASQSTGPTFEVEFAYASVPM